MTTVLHAASWLQVVPLSRNTLSSQLVKKGEGVDPRVVAICPAHTEGVLSNSPDLLKCQLLLDGVVMAEETQFAAVVLAELADGLTAPKNFARCRRTVYRRWWTRRSR